MQKTHFESTRETFALVGCNIIRVKTELETPLLGSILLSARTIIDFSLTQKTHRAQLINTRGLKAVREGCPY